MALIMVNELKAGFRCSASEHVVAVSRLYNSMWRRPVSSTAETACCVILKLSQRYLICLIYRIDLVYVTEKHGRKVPILMTAKMVNGINALLTTRDTVGVYGDNQYVFAAPTRAPSK